jgi:DNA invertase Pin-like site-specific DNA recombinase
MRGSTTVKAGVYVRVSSDPNDTRLGVTRQTEDCVKLCQTKGWEPVIYTENDTSASHGTRPVYQQLVADIESGALAAVCVYHLDRLHRRPIELEQFITLADTKRIALATVSGDVDLGTDNGRLIARITGAVARAEMERKSARMIRANLQAAEMGVMRGATRAFGYTPDNHLDPRTAPAVRRAYEAVLGGASLRGIADQWNQAGYTSQTGKPWERVGVRKVLLNPRNAGLRAHKGEIVVKDGVPVAGKWPAIIDRDTFDAVVALLKNPDRLVVKAPGRKYLLSGIALCGKCGHPLGSTIPAKGRGPRYQCKHCYGITRSVQDVDALILGLVAGRLSRPDAAGLLQAPEGPGLGEVRRRANLLRLRQEQMAEAFADGAVTMAQLRKANEKIAAELAAIDATLIDAGRSRVLADAIAADPAQVTARLHALPLDRRRAIVDLLMTITVLPAGGKTFNPERVHVVWK